MKYRVIRYTPNVTESDFDLLKLEEMEREERLVYEAYCLTEENRVSEDMIMAKTYDVFEEVVNQAIIEGWHPQGGIVFSPTGDYLQAMIMT